MSKDGATPFTRYLSAEDKALVGKRCADLSKGGQMTTEDLARITAYGQMLSQLRLMEDVGAATTEQISQKIEQLGPRTPVLLKQLIGRLLAPEPNERLTPGGLASHPLVVACAALFNPSPALAMKSSRERESRLEKENQELRRVVQSLVCIFVGRYAKQSLIGLTNDLILSVSPLPQI